MRTPITPGKRLITTLNQLLTPPLEWTEAEEVTLGLIESSADRAAVLTELLDAELAKDPVSTRRVTEVAGEIRQLEANIQKWTATLDPQMTRQKSDAHVYAANIRWGNRGATA